MTKYNINQTGLSINGFPGCYMVGVEGKVYLGDTDTLEEAIALVMKDVTPEPGNRFVSPFVIQYNPQLCY